MLMKCSDIDVDTLRCRSPRGGSSIPTRLDDRFIGRGIIYSVTDHSPIVRFKTMYTPRLS